MRGVDNRGGRRWMGVRNVKNPNPVSARPIVIIKSAGNRARHMLYGITQMVECSASIHIISLEAKESNWLLF